MKHFHKKSIQILLLAVVAISMMLSFAACGEKAVEEDSTPESSAPQPTATTEPVEVDLHPEQPELYREDIDFLTLTLRNNDIIGWLDIPAIDVDYPIMKGLDNVYYLTHDEDENEDPYGAIFADMSNAFDFSDPMVVLYGHRGNKRGHFLRLSDFYYDEDFFNDDTNREVYVYTPKVQKKYEIVAVFRTDDRNILYETDYSDKAVMKEFVEWMDDNGDENAQLKLDGVNGDDTFLVMSTCTETYGADRRHLVVAKFVEEVEVLEW